jgi:hypothetical protein
MTLGIIAFSEGPLSSLGKQDAIAVVTGQALTSALGTETVAVDATVSVTGLSINSTTGTAVIDGGAGIGLTGQNITSALGTVIASPTANPTVSVSGFGLNAVIGTFGVTAGGQVSIDASSEPDLDLFLGDETVTATALVQPTGLTETFTVTVQNVGGSNKYFIDGTQQPTLTLEEKNIYIFSANDSSVDTHPLLLSATSDGTHSGGTTYETGVTYQINGSDVSKSDYLSNYASATTRSLTINVAESAPTLYYYCNAHSGMGGQANTPTNTNYDSEEISTALGTVSVAALTDIAVTGQALTSALGTVSIATTSVAAVTGQAMTAALGASIISADASVLPTGQAVNTALGTVVPITNTIVEVTGQTMSLAQGNSGVYAWQVVDDAATNTWTIVDDSATNTWRDAA